MIMTTLLYLMIQIGSFYCHHDGHFVSYDENMVLLMTLKTKSLTNLGLTMGSNATSHSRHTCGSSLSKAGFMRCRRFSRYTEILQTKACFHCFEFYRRAFLVASGIRVRSSPVLSKHTFLHKNPIFLCDNDHTCLCEKLRAQC